MARRELNIVQSESTNSSNGRFSLNSGEVGGGGSSTILSSSQVLLGIELGVGLKHSLPVQLQPLHRERLRYVSHTSTTSRLRPRHFGRYYPRRRRKRQPPDDYGCKGAILRLPFHNRDIILFSGPGRRDKRDDITMQVSFDRGESWPVKRVIKTGPSNYTWMVAGRKGTPSEGMIYLLFNKDWMASFNLAWLLQKPENESGRK